jgi:hypothetical protein
VVDVLVDEVLDVVDDVVEVGAAVVAGVVVVVDTGSDDDVTAATDDDVEPESVVVDPSLLQLAIVAAMRATATRRFDFTPEVWHASCRLPDQGVCLVPTFNKL